MPVPISAEYSRRPWLPRQKGETFFADFEPYAPSYNQPAAFIASPIFNDNLLIGVLIFQLPIDRINNIMTDGHQWERVGLGKTGQSLLIGRDLKFRSNSRHLVENPEKLSQELLAAGHTQEEVNRALFLKTAIGTLTFDSPIVKEALQGKEGIELAVDYRGKSVRAGYAPPGHPWDQVGHRHCH